MPSDPKGAGWHPDPTGRHEHRYFNGTSWTDDVSDRGRQSKDPFQPLAGGPEQPTFVSPTAGPAADGGSAPPQLERKMVRRGTAVAIAIAAAVVGLIIGVAIGGTEETGDGQASAAAETVTVTTPGKTKTVKTRGKTKTVFETKTVRAPAAPASDGSSDSSSEGRTFSGNGARKLEPFTIDEPANLKWTNDGDIFQIFDIENGLVINSDASSGENDMEPGTYTLDVNALGNWTIEVVPA